MKKIEAEALKSKIITKKARLETALEKVLKKKSLKEKDIIAVSSKVLAVSQGRIAAIRSEKDFNKLVRKEADRLLGGKQVELAVKNQIFTPWAGVDRSNIQKNSAVLWPAKPFNAAEQIRKHLQKAFKIKKLGIIIVDSFCVPLRKGVSGIALGYAGFEGVMNKRGSKDLFGNKLKITQEAVADNLAAIANLLMGQANEQTPFVLIRNAPVKFTDRNISPNEPVMNAKDCLYAPLYPW